MQLTSNFSEFEVGTELLLDTIGKNNPCLNCYKVEEKLDNKLKYGFSKPAITPRSQTYNCKDCPYKN